MVRAGGAGLLPAGRRALSGLAAAALVTFAPAACGPSQTASSRGSITLASTTSIQNSGLLDHVLPRFTAATGIQVRVVAVGTGQALRLGERGDTDVILVHHAPSEEEFVAAGFGVRRWPIMANDFVLLGPAADPAGAAGGDAVAALGRIAAARAPFVSRGDDSGTHMKELELWELAGVDPAKASGTWYRAAGSGMGTTLNVAAGMQAYTLADRATWLASGRRGGLALLVEQDPRLANPYAAIPVNPARHPHVNADAAQAFIDWLRSPAGRAAIASFTVDGEQVFFPVAD